MSRIHITIDEEAEKIIVEKFGNNKRGISKYIGNLILQDYEDTKNKEEKQLNVIKKIARNSDNNLEILLGAFNNFLLNFAPTDDTNFQSINDNPHLWIEQAAEKQEDKVKQQYRKWSGYE